MATTIYFAKGEYECTPFMSWEGMAKWLLEKQPIDKVFYTLSGIVGENKKYFEISANNLQAIYDISKKEVGLCPSIRIATKDLFCGKKTEEYIISTMLAND